MTGLATTYTKRGTSIVMALLLAAFALVAAYAVAVPSAWAATGSIKVQYQASDTSAGIANMQVNAYKVADVVGDEYVLTDEMKAQQPSGWTNGKASVNSDTAWVSAQAETLENIIRTSWHEPEGFAITDTAGAATISNLESGLYLIFALGDPNADVVHRFLPSLVNVSGEGEDLGVFEVDPKEPVVLDLTTEVQVVKHWVGDTKSNARPVSIKVQLACDGKPYGDVVELSDANAWKYVWRNLDANTPHIWSVKEVEVPSNYTFSITEDKETGIFTVTNTLKKTEIIISKQEVGGGPELPGATLIVKDENGNVIEEWISGTEPHKITLEPGVYTLTEITAPEGFEIAETITFRVNADGTTEVLQDGQWVDCNNHVTMFDARTPEVPPENPPTNTPGTPTTTTVTGKLPQTGQLWWPVPALLCAGLVSVGAGRIVATRSARK